METAKPQPRIRTLAHYLDTCGDYTTSELRDRYGDFFLICTGGMLNIPEGPMQTDKVSASTLRAVAQQRPLPFSPVFTIAGSTTSPYSFITLGRTSNCDIFVPDESVSKLHAVFRRAGTGLAVQDAGSRNGTDVDEVAVPAQGKPGQLRTGATVRFGSVTTIFQDAAGLHTLLRNMSREPVVDKKEDEDATAGSEAPLILIVEDDLRLRDHMTDHLQRAGYDVMAVASPFEACLNAIRNRPALVLVDYRLPGMNGGRVCESIKGARQQTPVCLMSALDDDEISALARRHGADSHFSKHKGLLGLVAHVTHVIGHPARHG